MRLTPRLAVVPAVICLMLISLAHADSVWIGGLERRNVKIQDVKEGNLQYEAAGQTTSRPLADVDRIMIDGEQALNSAEEAYKLRDYDKAADGYARTLKATSKKWLQDWCRVRLLDSAARAGRFDAAVVAFVQLVEANPAAASQINLDLPKPDSAMLTTAAKELETASKTAKKAEARIAMLQLLNKIYAHQGKKKEAEEVLNKIVDAEIAADPNGPRALAAKLRKRLMEIQSSIDGKEFDKAIAAIEKEAPTITEPADQVEALMMLAEARAGKAAGSTDAAVWKEVAVAYLRVVVNAPPKSAQAASALMRLAVVHETKLNEKASALKLYQTVASDYKELPIAKEAEKEAARLKG